MSNILPKPSHASKKKKATTTLNKEPVTSLTALDEAACSTGLMAPNKALLPQELVCVILISANKHNRMLEQ